MLSNAGPEGAHDSAPPLCPQEVAFLSGSKLETDLAVEASLSSTTIDVIMLCMPEVLPRLVVM